MMSTIFLLSSISLSFISTLCTRTLGRQVLFLALLCVGCVSTIAAELRPNKVALHQDHSPPVIVELRTSWNTPDPLIDILETIAIEQPSAFFSLLSALANSSVASQEGYSASTRASLSPQDVHIHILSLASSFLDRNAIASVDALLAVHAASPVIEAFRDWYHNSVKWKSDVLAPLQMDEEEGLKPHCRSWIDWYGQVVCDADTLRQLVVASLSASSEMPSTPQRLPFDHVHPSPTDPPYPRLSAPQYAAILYADFVAGELELVELLSQPGVLSLRLPQSNFQSLHAALMELSSGPEANVEYIFRWATPSHLLETNDEPESDKQTYLSGYGVALDLKKMDYLALDDRARAARALSHVDHEEEVDETPSSESDLPWDGGDPVSVLLGALSDLPLKFQNYPPEDDNGEAQDDLKRPLSEDEIAELGIKATYLLSLTSRSAGHNLSISKLPSTLAVLSHLSQYFPLHSLPLARQVPLPSADLRDEVRMNWMRAPPGVSMMWINGKVVGEGGGSSSLSNSGSSSVVDKGVVGLLRALRKERHLVNSLVELGLDRPQAINLLTHPAHSDPSAYRTHVPRALRSQKPLTDQTTITEGKIMSEDADDAGYETQSDKDDPIHDSSDDPSPGDPQQSLVQPPDSVIDLVDASDRAEGGDVILWWNNLEKDSRYIQWTVSLRVLVRRLFPGQYPSIKLNIWNVVLLLDLSRPQSLSLLSGPVDNIIGRNFPFRWGVVPIVSSSEGSKMARLFYYLIDNYGRARTMAFFRSVSTAHQQAHLPFTKLSIAIIRAQFLGLVETEAPQRPYASLDFDEIIEGTSTYRKEEEQGSATDDLGITATQFTVADRIQNAQQYARRLGVTDSQGHAFVNGKHLDLSDSFLQLMQVEIMHQLQYLQDLYIAGELPESHYHNISTFFYDLPTTLPRRNPHIVPTSSGSGVNVRAKGSLRLFNLPEVFRKAGFSIPKGGFVEPETKHFLPIAMYVIADFATASGLGLLKEALNFMATSSRSRMTFIHNPTNTSSETTDVAGHIVGLFLKGLLSQIRLDLFAKDTANDVDNIEEILKAIKTQIEFDSHAYSAYLTSSRLLMNEFELIPGEQAILVNGRLVGPFQEGGFIMPDFSTLESYEFRKRVVPIVAALDEILQEAVVTDPTSYADLLAAASSIVSSVQQPDPIEAGLFDSPLRPRTRTYNYLNGNHTTFTFGNKSTALYQIAVLLDPLSETAQKWSSILEWLIELPDVYLQLHINPSQHLEIPLKRFYRSAIEPRLRYDVDGQEVPAKIVFDGLPVEPIYTLAMDVPPSWLVRPREAFYDLDNIQLGTVSDEDQFNGVRATFDLDYIVIEGHARESGTNIAPRGLQLQIVSTNAAPVDDTLVVANLGYFQLKVKPGVYQLEIRRGRGQDIFEMESAGSEGWNSPTAKERGNRITAMSFEGLTLYPRFTRKPGMALADVLEEADSSVPRTAGLIDNVISLISSVFLQKGADGTAAKHEGQADINIFTVASGLLYERFASIMILSVLRNTNSSVKFWFIENFLSPSFLEFIPHMAETYGFQYELVTYKWPSWLRAQKEKQRIIWAYKILFLDVLFPMDLRKVIFVDADQIVRADLKELVDLDLHGAPYGYTPMGDDNTDMEGFRFWKTGYWKDFLRGRPYHISALYVVDLVRFRQIAAGDILRGQYQALSADPNSLANLDQDLPNNLQEQVPIFSLHEDWLWCETWCSKDRLHRAKTIDLCQNPLTKEPKLSRARQIPEWEEYDTEISRFARRLAEEGKIRSSIVATDANVLANAGTSTGAAVTFPSDAKGVPDADYREEHLQDEL